MEVYRSINDIKPMPKSVVTMGTYDGIHRGHQEIIKRCVAYAKAMNSPSVVITLHPHPRTVTSTKHPDVALILHIEEKISMLKELGVDHLLIIPFSESVRQLTASQFLSDVIMKYFNPTKFVIGYDHHFGFKKQGSPEFLTDYANRNGIGIEIVKAVSDEGSIISSTEIRRLISEGYVRRASFELGWIYGFSAKVVRGSGRGSKMHYPTANFVPFEKSQLLPKKGVYLTRGIVDGQTLYGMCNLGVRPTFEEGDFVMEVHFFDKSVKDLYDETIRIEFLERVRDEVKFSSEQALIEQLDKDKTHCVALLAKYI